MQQIITNSGLKQHKKCIILQFYRSEARNILQAKI